MTTTAPLVIAEGSRVRLRVLGPDELPAAEPEAGGDEPPDVDELEPLDVQRPRTRGECATVARPCPWVGCRMNLFLDVIEAGTIRQNRPGEPGDMAPEHSCALDVASRGELTLEEIGDLFGGLSRERIRQIERDALRRFGLRGGARLAELADAEPDDRLW